MNRSQLILLIVSWLTIGSAGYVAGRTATAERGAGLNIDQDVSAESPGGSVGCR